MQIYMSDRGERVIEFIETLRIPEGMHVGQPFRLRDWQKEIIRRVYNPVDENGRRVVRKVLYSVAKKNGKTPFVAAIGLTHLCGPEAKQNEQLYSAAFQRDQSGITHRYMSQMVELDDELTSLLNIKSATKEITAPNGSVFKALSSEVKGKHGIGPALLIFDELAQFGADREFYDTLIQGRGAHKEPLMWIISTQAKDDLAVLSQEIDYGMKVMRGEVDDPSVVCFLFTTPEDADLEDEDAWRLSNPAMGDFLSETDLREAARTAKNMPSAEANFRNLRLNQRIDSAAHFIAPGVWKANGGEPDLSIFDEVECFGGLDLSAKNDLTALVFEAEDEERGIHIMPFFWTPGDTLRERENRDRVPYTLWRDQGYIVAVPGRTLDYGFIARKIQGLMEWLHIAGIKFDRWRIEDLKRELDKIGVQVWIDGVDEPIDGGLRLVPHGQGYKDMNPAVETVEDVLTEERVRHGMHPVLTWCASNVRIQSDPAGNRKFDKMKSTGRIDGMVAMAMAINGAVTIGEVESGMIEAGFLDLGAIL